MIHHHGYTHERITQLAHSLNETRRHLTTSQRQMIAAKLADRERTDTLKRGASRSSKTSDGKISEPEAAKMMKVGRTGVQAAKKVLREAPEKATAIATGKLTVGKAVRELKPKKPKKETPFEDKVWLKWSAWLKKWPPSQLPQVKRLVHEWSGEGRLAA